MSKNICVITARGGSKGIPKKNILNICGKPLLHYSLETSFKAGIYEDLIVSSEDNEILDCARLLWIAFAPMLPEIGSLAKLTSN